MNDGRQTQTCQPALGGAQAAGKVDTLCNSDATVPCGARHDVAKYYGCHLATFRGREQARGQICFDSCLYNCRELGSLRLGT